MIDQPWMDEMPEQLAAFIPISAPRDQIQTVISLGLTEMRSTLNEQGIETSGPWLTHHHYLKPGEFHFDLCFPVKQAVTPQGRVRSCVIAARKVVRTIHRGPYEELSAAWGALMQWVAAERLSACIDFFECSAKGPESVADPAKWETVLSVPLIE
jgi:effector-binding domain-containing protein